MNWNAEWQENCNELKRKSGKNIALKWNADSTSKDPTACICELEADRTTLNMHAASSYETLATMYDYIAPSPEDHTLNRYLWKPQSHYTWVFTSTMKMEAACLSEMLMTTYQNIRPLNPKYHKVNLHDHDNPTAIHVSVIRVYCLAPSQPGRAAVTTVPSVCTHITIR
jgi:hypothetical protein